MHHDWKPAAEPVFVGDEVFSNAILTEGMQAIVDLQHVPAKIVFNDDGYTDFKASDILPSFIDIPTNRVFGILFEVDSEAEHRYAFYPSEVGGV